MSQHAPACPAFRYPGLFNDCTCGARKSQASPNPPDVAALDGLIADVEQRTALKLRIANAEGPLPFGTASATSVARKVIADCKDPSGAIHEDSLLHSISKIVVLLYRAQGRLPLIRDLVTGKVHDP